MAEIQNDHSICRDSEFCAEDKRLQCLAALGVTFPIRKSVLADGTSSMAKSNVDQEYVTQEQAPAWECLMTTYNAG